VVTDSGRRIEGKAMVVALRMSQKPFNAKEN